MAPSLDVLAAFVSRSTFLRIREVFFLPQTALFCTSFVNTRLLLYPRQKEKDQKTFSAIRFCLTKRVLDFLEYFCDQAIFFHAKLNFHTKTHSLILPTLLLWR